MATRSTLERVARKSPFAAPRVYVLAVIDGEAPDAVHRIVKAETVVGRDEDADFRLDDEQVSGKHCLIRVDGPVCTLVELGSLNGTRVNFRRVPADSALRLRHLDVIELGNTRLMLLTGRFAERPPQA